MAFRAIAPCICFLRQLSTSSVSAAGTATQSKSKSSTKKRPQPKDKLPSPADGSSTRPSLRDILNGIAPIPVSSSDIATTSNAATPSKSKSKAKTSGSSKAKKVPPKHKRPTLTDVDLARDLVRAWGVDKLHDAVVVEPYAGPGGLTRALLELKNVKRIIAIEQSGSRFTEALELARREIDDPARLVTVGGDPYVWETYTDIERAGHLSDVPKRPWSELHDGLFVACQVPSNRYGETLLVQFISTLAEQLWLHKYGRFRMGFLASKAFVDKVLAPPGARDHHKLAVILPALASIERVQDHRAFSRRTFPLTDPDAHFHKAARDAADVVPILVTPKVKVDVDSWDTLDYCARNMFISRTLGWAKGVAAISPGAENLVPKMLEKGMPPVETPINRLEPEHWTIIANVFNAWPFKPELHDELNFT